MKNSPSGALGEARPGGAPERRGQRCTRRHCVLNNNMSAQGIGLMEGGKTCYVWNRFLLEVYS